MKDKQAAMWLSKFRPTVEQLAEIDEMGYTLVEHFTGMSISNRELVDDESVATFLDDVAKLVKALGTDIIFGAVEIPVLAFLGGKAGKAPRLYLPWYLRNDECVYPATKYTHHKWVPVGYLNINI